MMLSSAEIERGMREISLEVREVPRTQAETKVLISELVALAKISEAIHTNEVLCWGMLLLQRMK